ncbi:MAG: DUF1232 domain-containing protein [Chloroflexota bacterium]|nr:DUF1232 domain-containing protein [Chloroflexota bacterium]
MWIALLALIAIWVLCIALLYLFGRKALAMEIARFIPNMTILFKGLLADPRVPRRAKIVLLFGAVWIASPIDLIPEFLPIIGPLDDAVVAALVLRAVVKAAGREVVYEHWRGDVRVIERLLALARV